MGAYIDTIGTFITAGATNPKALAAVTPSPGDSLTVRSFTPQGWAKLEALFLQGSVKTQARITSPMFHDNVTGLTFDVNESPSMYIMPRQVGQPLVTGDTLSVLYGSAAGTSGIAALLAYYNDPNGPVTRLHSWGDIASIIKSVKPLEVDVTSSATVGTWSDTAINTTDKQLHAHTDYAVLGYTGDTALAVIGIKGQATGNLRVCGPGATQTLDMSDYYQVMSADHGTPHIPVFNSDNQGATYVSCLANTASVASKIYLMLAELTQTITP